jgi:hypothetical protein
MNMVCTSVKVSHNIVHLFNSRGLTIFVHLLHEEFTLNLAGFSKSIVLQHLSTSMLVLKTKISLVSIWNYRLIRYMYFGIVEGAS